MGQVKQDFLNIPHAKEEVDLEAADYPGRLGWFEQSYAWPRLRNHLEGVLCWTLSWIVFLAVVYLYSKSFHAELDELS